MEEKTIKKILLIEDNSIIVKMYQRKFQMEGYEVETAYDGEEGLEKAKKIKPNIILLDVMIPKIEGLEVLKKLKGDQSTKHIPVVILSNLAGEEVKRGLQLGAKDYLVKSEFTPAQVVEKIKNALAK